MAKGSLSAGFAVAKYTMPCVIIRHRYLLPKFGTLLRID